MQSSAQFGFNSSHTEILENHELISYLLDRMKGVKNVYPEEHLQYCFMGGDDVELSDDYSPMDKHVIHNYGKYWNVVANGTLKPFYEEQEYFIKVVQGEAPAKHDVVKGWLKFMWEYPEFLQ